MHLHKLPNGSLVVHAHPFSKSSNPESPVQNHQHTKVELLILDNLQLLTTLGTLVFLLLGTAWSDLFIIRYSYSLRENTPLHTTNKAPPSFSFSF